VQYHPELTKLFVTNLKKGQVTIAGVTFTISIDIRSPTIGIPNMGEKWFKIQELDAQLYQSYLKAPYKDNIKKIFPFGQLLDKFSPLMKIIMKYFTYEGRFSRIYGDHIRFIMHFTREKLLNIPYYLYRSIEKWHTKYNIGKVSYNKIASFITPLSRILFFITLNN